MELDYKEDILMEDGSGAKNALASLAKDVIAMSNSGGGRIIVGVAEKGDGSFEYRGVSDERLGFYEVTKLNEQLKKYTGTVRVGVRIVSESGRKFVVIRVAPVMDTIVFPACGHQGAALYEGRIYIRRQDARTAELRDSLEAARLVQQLARRIAGATTTSTTPITSATPGL
jgi:predicted HTH transcriptional regulator